MNTYADNFIKLAIDKKALLFGEFILKSKRPSPYFFNMGMLSDGDSFKLIGDAYAKTILDHQLEFDMLFGPAYKGLPLATTTSISLSQQGYNYPVCFNRKEAKAHGEGGNLIGAPLKGRVLILDDVITAGTAFRESKALVESQGATVSGLVIALDRMEKMADQLSAVEHLKQQYHIPVISLISLQSLIQYLSRTEPQQAKILQAHYQTYGAQNL